MNVSPQRRTTPQRAVMPSSRARPSLRLSPPIGFLTNECEDDEEQDAVAHDVISVGTLLGDAVELVRIGHLEAKADCGREGKTGQRPSSDQQGRAILHGRSG